MKGSDDLGEMMGGTRIQEFVLLGIIVLSVGDFLNLLSPFWGYVNNLISWILIGFLFYEISVSDVLLGDRRPWFDLTFIIAAFLMNFNDILEYMQSASEEMMHHIASYLAFERIPAATAGIMTNVSDIAYNTISILGAIPDAPELMLRHATEITMGTQELIFTFVKASDPTQTFSYALTPVGIDGALLQVYNTLMPYGATIMRTGVLVGIAIIAFLAFAGAVRIPVKKPSLLAVIDREGDPQGIAGLTYRVVTLFLALTAFFLFAFNLIVEWLGIALDDPLLVVGLGIAGYALLRGHRHDEESFIKRVANFGQEFYERFLRFFHERRYIPLAIAGLLVLHVLTELGNFLLPYTLPLRDSLYFSRFGPGHENLYLLAIQQFTSSWSANAALVIVTTLVITAWAFLLTTPGYIWYTLFQLRHDPQGEHTPHLGPVLLSLFYASCATALLVPLITIRPLAAAGVVGVDFLTRTADVALVDPLEAVIIAVAIFAIVYFFSLFERARTYLMIGPLFAGVAFLGVYIAFFFQSLFTYYLADIIAAWFTAHIALTATLALFLVMSLVFYVSGYLMFLYEIGKE